MEQANLSFQYEKVHQMLGHPGRNKLIETSNILKWKISSPMTNKCEDCLKGKVHQLRRNKEVKDQSKKPGERIMIDISSIKTSKKNLLSTRPQVCTWSFFLTSKAAQVPFLIGPIKGLNVQKKQVKFICCNNAGEKKSLEKKVDEEGIDIKFEYTARNTPQQNGKVQRAFAALYERMRAMVTAVTILISPEDLKRHLRILGEIGIVTANPGITIKSKLEDTGIKCMFVGYAANHAGNIYRMVEMKTRKVLITRDVSGLNTFDQEVQKNAIYQDDEDDDIDLPTQRTEEQPHPRLEIGRVLRLTYRYFPPGRLLNPQ